MTRSAVLHAWQLGFPWETSDPFLFCVHHDDAYPAGNENLGPAASLAGRRIGMDFEGKDGWRMYHGDVVPGFPQHPHRGFETVTLARRGFIDHSDSLGATARFGKGDAQWMTAGGGIVHSEMFPLLDPSGPNPVELFQLWLNLPGEDKLVEPHFTMLWSHTIPTFVATDANGRKTHATIVAGRIGDLKAPAPPPRSWAARPDTDVAIWTIVMDPGARWTLPPAQPGSSRNAYLFAGGPLAVGGSTFSPQTGIALRPDIAVDLANGEARTEILLLQGRPIGEPVAAHGPFVMNSPQEINEAIREYRRTEFGGWPWPSHGPVHPRDAGRFAKHVGGRVERVA